MSELRERYERETGKSSYHPPEVIYPRQEKSGRTEDYAAWLEAELESSQAILQGALDRAADLEAKEPTMSKVSDEFFRVRGDGLGNWDVLAPDHAVCVYLRSEADARHICDLHNAAIVQEKRGWTVRPVKCKAGFIWEVAEIESLPLEEILAIPERRMDTPAAALLAANAWIESHEAACKGEAQ